MDKVKKEKVRINLDVPKELAEEIKSEADRRALAVNALIRIALDTYLKSIIR